jgi:hypothetical protein
MRRPINQNHCIRASFGLLLALALGSVRTEKIWAETFGEVDSNATHLALPLNDQEPFDPLRVPQSGGMAGRLLAGIKGKLG